MFPEINPVRWNYRFYSNALVVGVVEKIAVSLFNFINKKSES